MASPPGDITHVPAPWKLKGTVYLFPFWTNKADFATAKSAGLAFSPLEGNSDYALPEGNEYLGGLGMVQIIRYTESPVGPYDELIILPGFWKHVVEENGERVKKKNNRITRIYVSQKYTCWNGRKNWNIPKHLASFEFKETPDGSTSIKVFHHNVPSDPTEASPSKSPLFQASFKPIPLVPSFPTSTNLLKYLGFDATLVQPPLPEGKDASQGELPGTDKWCAIVPGQYTRRATVGWMDLQQGQGETEFENFWPGMKRWHVGVRMEDAEITFGEGTYWDPPKSQL